MKFRFDTKNLSCRSKDFVTIKILQDSLQRRPGELVRDGGGDEAHQHHRANRGGNVQGNVGSGRNGLQNSADLGPLRGSGDHGAAGVHPPGS